MIRRNSYLELAILALVLGVAAWRIMSVGLSEHYERQATLGDRSAVDKSLAWNERNPDALFSKAGELAGTDPQRAMRLLHKALMLNPVNAHALVLLANLELSQGLVERADVSMNASVGLMPSSSAIRMQAASYWSARQRMDLVLENWDAALKLSPYLGKQVFPSMLQLFSTDQGIKLLSPFTSNPPPWWDNFFTYVASNAPDTRVLVGLAAVRHESSTPLSKVEREQLVERLLKEQLWPEAYLVWVNGLSNEQKRFLAGVYDGGFESTPSGKGFDWHLPEVRNVMARYRETYGADGKKALAVFFRGNDAPFQHLYQQLFLGQGRYQFHARVRVDSLRTKGGLRWLLRCAGEQTLVLAQSERLVGATDWDSMQFNFDVPARKSCASQILRLESAADTPFDHRIEGEVWFDQVQIFSRDQAAGK